MIAKHSNADEYLERISGQYSDMSYSKPGPIFALWSHLDSG